MSVAALERALTFYRDVLALEPVSVGPGLVVLSAPEGPEVLLHERQAIPSPAGVSV